MKAVSFTSRLALDTSANVNKIRADNGFVISLSGLISRISVCLPPACRLAAAVFFPLTAVGLSLPFVED